MSLLKKECEFCAFWKVISADGYDGECHRYAPRPMVSSTNEYTVDTDWPQTGADNFCGDFNWRSDVPDEAK